MAVNPNDAVSSRISALPVLYVLLLSEIRFTLTIRSAYPTPACLILLPISRRV